MNLNSSALLNKLKKIVSEHLVYSKQLLQEKEEKLQWRKREKSWSVLECLQHLNLYATFYNNEIENKMNLSTLPFASTYKSGFWGNKFAIDMLPKEKMNKMNTFKSKNPIHSNLDKETVLLEFIKRQEKLLDLLDIASKKDLNIRTKTTLPFVKFRLGDTFRFVINHNVRHIKQAEVAFENYGQ